MPILKEEEVIVFRGYPSGLRKMPQLKKKPHSEIANYLEAACR